MSAELANFSIAASILLAGVAAALMIVGLVSAIRLKHGRMVAVTLAFGILAAQGIVSAVQAYAQRAEPTFPLLTLMSLGVVLALYAAVLKR